MIQKDDILLKEVTEALRGQQAPRVDVAEKVMAALPELKVRRLPVAMRVVRRACVAAAACLALVVAFDLVRLYTHDYDEDALGQMLAKSNDAELYFDGYADYESAIGFDYAYVE